MEIYKTKDSKEHLCNYCGRSHDFPKCYNDNIKFGDGFGNDNIIECDNFVPKEINNNIFYKKEK